MFSGSVLIAQGSRVSDLNKFYSGFYYKHNDRCFTYVQLESIEKLDRYDIKDGYVSMDILSVSENYGALFIDDQGFYVPYESGNGERYINYLKDQYDYEETIESSRLKDLDMPISALDSIFIIRQQEKAMWVRRTDKDGKTIYCIISAPVEVIKFITLKNTDSKSKFNSHLISVDVEMDDGDIVSNDPRLEVVCPDKIDKDLVINLNKRLVLLGYLDDIQRDSYLPDIRNALIEYQEGMGFYGDFLFKRTLATLEIDLE